MCGEGVYELLGVRGDVRSGVAVWAPEISENR